MGKITYQERVLLRIKLGEQLSTIADDEGVSRERIRQIRQRAFGSARTKITVADNDLCLYTLGPKTRKAINTAAGKEITTVDEFRIWIESFASGKPKLHNMAEKISKLGAFSDPHKKALIDGVIRLCIRLDLVEDLHF